MIVGIRVLRDETCTCGNKATYDVTRTNTELEGIKSEDGIPYCTYGTRTVYYCDMCVPEEVTGQINSMIEYAKTPI